MFQPYFYHQRIRKTVSMFGRLFNNLYVIRQNTAGDIINTVKVPLSYAPKDKYLERIRTNPDLDTDQKVALKLPRMSFEILAMNYDPLRQLSKTGSRSSAGGSNGSRKRLYNAVPYNIQFQLNLYAKSQDDALQILEQIIPSFNPQYTIGINPLEDLADIKEDIPVTLQGVTFLDDFEGDLADRRTIIYALDFEMKINFYGAINEGNVITKSIIELDADCIQDSDNPPYLKLTIDPDPLTATAEDDYGFTETYEFGDEA